MSNGTEGALRLACQNEGYVVVNRGDGPMSITVTFGDGTSWGPPPVESRLAFGGPGPVSVVATWGDGTVARKTRTCPDEATTTTTTGAAPTTVATTAPPATTTPPITSGPFPSQPPKPPATLPGAPVATVGVPDTLPFTGGPGTGEMLGGGLLLVALGAVALLTASGRVERWRHRRDLDRRFGPTARKRVR